MRESPGDVHHSASSLGIDFSAGENQSQEGAFCADKIVQYVAPAIAPPPGPGPAPIRGNAPSPPITSPPRTNSAGPAVLRLLLRSTRALITQMTQTGVCNRHHFIEQQQCRALLAW